MTFVKLAPKVTITIVVRFDQGLLAARNINVIHCIIRAAYLGQNSGDTATLEYPQAVHEISHAQ